MMVTTKLRTLVPVNQCMIMLHLKNANNVTFSIFSDIFHVKKKKITFNLFLKKFTFDLFFLNYSKNYIFWSVAGYFILLITPCMSILSPDVELCMKLTLPFCYKNFKAAWACIVFLSERKQMLHCALA